MDEFSSKTISEIPQKLGLNKNLLLSYHWHQRVLRELQRKVSLQKTHNDLIHGFDELFTSFAAVIFVAYI